MIKQKKWNMNTYMIRVSDGYDNENYCAISGDKLERIYDEDEEDWFFKDCKKLTKEESEKFGVPEGSICIIDYIQGDEFYFHRLNLIIRHK